jgi:hypothetical protein
MMSGVKNTLEARAKRLKKSRKKALIHAGAVLSGFVDEAASVKNTAPCYLPPHVKTEQFDAAYAESLFWREAKQSLAQMLDTANKNAALADDEICDYVYGMYNLLRDCAKRGDTEAEHLYRRLAAKRPATGKRRKAAVPAADVSMPALDLSL